MMLNADVTKTKCRGGGDVLKCMLRDVVSDEGGTEDDSSRVACRSTGGLWFDRLRH